MKKEPDASEDGLKTPNSVSLPYNFAGEAMPILKLKKLFELYEI